jgi:hypothetical protein
MTAEVAVLNKSAVALAADSKVTIGAGSPEKTYDSVNKIFTLSKIHPVGLMIYGNADFMQYPWETIVKSYRAKKGARSEPTIDRWAGDFIRYVRGFGQIRKRDIHHGEQASDIPRRSTFEATFQENAYRQFASSPARTAHFSGASRRRY